MLSLYYRIIGLLYKVTKIVSETMAIFLRFLTMIIINSLSRINDNIEANLKNITF